MNKPCLKKSYYLLPSVGLLLNLISAQPLRAIENLPKNGEAILAIMASEDNVQLSNYGKKSFVVSNTGSKNIVLFRLDVAESLFPDGVFDPEGIAGDSVSKPLAIDEDTDTGVILPTGVSSDIYIGQGGPAGYKGIQLRFRENGFNPGEKIAFSVDMDPNSIAGTEKAPIDTGSSPGWDVGGVSGAELIGSVFTVTFSDGTTASGQLGGTATQAGSRGIASQMPRIQKADLQVNGLNPGNVGTYSTGGPEILITGPDGTTARVIVAKGFIQPVSPYDHRLEQQLKALTRRPFPVNNAVEILTVDIEMTGKAINISDRFNFSKVANYNFKSDPTKPLSVDDDKLSLGITAAIIDKNQENLPLGPLTKPIYLNYQK